MGAHSANSKLNNSSVETESTRSISGRFTQRVNQRAEEENSEVWIEVMGIGKERQRLCNCESHTERHTKMSDTSCRRWITNELKINRSPFDI